VFFKNISRLKHGFSMIKNIMLAQKCKAFFCYRGHHNITPRSQHVFRFEASVSGIRQLAESITNLDHNQEALENLKDSRVDLIGIGYGNPPLFLKFWTEISCFLFVLCTGVLIV